MSFATQRRWHLRRRSPHSPSNIQAEAYLGSILCGKEESHMLFLLKEAFNPDLLGVKVSGTDKGDIRFFMISLNQHLYTLGLTGGGVFSAVPTPLFSAYLPKVIIDSTESTHQFLGELTVAVKKLEKAVVLLNEGLSWADTAQALGIPLSTFNTLSSIFKSKPY